VVLDRERRRIVELRWHRRGCTIEAGEFSFIELCRQARACGGAWKAQESDLLDAVRTRKNTEKTVWMIA
jgi:hypothetical protein